MILEIIGIIGIGWGFSTTRSPWWLVIPLMIYGAGLGFRICPIDKCCTRRRAAGEERPGLGHDVDIPSGRFRTRCCDPRSSAVHRA